VSIVRPPTDLGEIAFSPGGEDWVEFGPVDARERVAFHDYAALYAVPGLYDRVFGEELGMCSAQRVVDLYARVPKQLDRPPSAERVLDLGAGNGIGGRGCARSASAESSAWISNLRHARPPAATGWASTTVTSWATSPRWPNASSRRS
jgi:hypothetical protein